eukprot:1184277-Prorocentrum_minimum.AAC.1
MTTIRCKVRRLFPRIPLPVIHAAFVSVFSTVLYCAVHALSYITASFCDRLMYGAVLYCAVLCTVLCCTVPYCVLCCPALRSPALRTNALRYLRGG